MIFIAVVFMSFGLSGMGASSMGEVLGEGCWDQVRERVEGRWLQAHAVCISCLHDFGTFARTIVRSHSRERCYKAATCGATDGASSFTRSWAPLFSLKPDGYGHCSSGAGLSLSKVVVTA